jgi:carotenoid cleavage dioxygenase
VQHIRVYGCAAESVDLNNLGGETARPGGGMMHMWRLDIVAGKCVAEVDLAPLSCDFAQIPADMVGRPNRYCYAANFCAGFSIDAVVKFDVQAGTHTIHRYSEGNPGTQVFGGESVFARRGTDGEDDGWLLSFVYGEKRCASESALEIVDAKTMRRVARVAMPNRVPGGFHAYWKPAE